MWYQILPGAAICLGCVYAPQIFVYIINRLAYGTPYLRMISKDYEGHMFLRDYRLTGSVYKQRTLDCLDTKDDQAEEEYIEECIPTRRPKNPPPEGSDS